MVSSPRLMVPLFKASLPANTNRPSSGSVFSSQQHYATILPW